MNSQTPLKRKTTPFLIASFLILSMLIGVLSACTAIVVTPKPTDVIGEEFLPSQDFPATAELTLASPTEVATEMPVVTLTPESTATVLPTEVVTEMMIPTLDLESATAVEDLRKLNEMFETNKDIDNIVLAPEQIFLDFYNKVIPKETDLRSNPSDGKLYNIGEPLIFDNGFVATVQATLMGGFTNNNGAYLLLGVESNTTGDRSIIPFQFTFGSEDPWATAGVHKDSSKTMRYNEEELVFIHANDLLNLVKENLGKNIAVNIILSTGIFPQTIPEVSRVAIEKYFLVERLKSNNLFINDPLGIDKNKLNESPWDRVFVY